MPAMAAWTEWMGPVAPSRWYTTTISTHATTSSAQRIGPSLIGRRSCIEAATLLRPHKGLAKGGGGFQHLEASRDHISKRRLGNPNGYFQLIGEVAV